MNRRGSALIVALAALAGAAMALVAFHLASVATLRLSRVSLAAARAREAAASGVALASTGQGAGGSLAGGGVWSVVIDSAAPGWLLLWSTGESTRPQRARLEVGALLPVPDSVGGGVGTSAPSAGWIVLRHE